MNFCYMLTSEYWSGYIHREFHVNRARLHIAKPFLRKFRSFTRLIQTFSRYRLAKVKVLNQMMILLNLIPPRAYKRRLVDAASWTASPS